MGRNDELPNTLLFRTPCPVLSSFRSPTKKLALQQARCASRGYLLEAYLHGAEIRRAKEAGAVMHQAHTECQGIEGYTKFSLKRKAQSQDIILYPRKMGLPGPLGISLIFVIIGVSLSNFLCKRTRKLSLRKPLCECNDEPVERGIPVTNG